MKAFTRQRHIAYSSSHRNLFACSMMVIILGLCSLKAHAQVNILIDDERFTVDAMTAIDSLYNRNESAAREILEPWQNRYPDHPIWALWRGMELWWLVLEDLEVTNHDDQFVELMRQADFEAGRLLRNQPDHTDALVVRAVSNSYIARMHANRKQWVTSLQVGRRGYQAHQRLMQVAPELPDNYFAEGMKYYYSAYVPETYPIVRPVAFFLPDGDREKGIDLLSEATQKAIFARPEATYFLATIYLNYEGNRSAARRLYYSLVNQYPNNGYYRRMVMNTLGQLRDYNTMIRFYHETMSHWKLNELPDHPVMNYEMAYWLGRAQYNLADYVAAQESFRKAVDIGSQLENKKDRNFYTLSTYYAGLTYEKLNNQELAVKYYTLTLDQSAMPEAVRRARERLRELDV